MNIDYILLAAKTMADKGEKEFSCNLPAFSQSFRMAAKKYRQAAEADPSKKNQYIELAEQYEAKAGQAIGSAPKQPQADNHAQTPKSSAQGSVKAKEPNAGGVESVSEDISVEEALARLNALVGLNGVKEKVQSWVSQVRVFQRRQSLGLPVPDGFSYHLVFSGNPGTGKTTVARFMAQIYKGLGILQGGQLVETQRSDLVAGYVGQTAQKTQDVVNKALGGVLFVDEAYTLNGNGGNDFGQEAIDALLKAMEDHRNELVVIVAGYTDLMQKFIDSNPGLKSRFNTVIEFEDYTGEEMQKIFDGLCNKNRYVLTPGARAMVSNYFNNLYANRDKNFGNGRSVRNVFQQVVLNQSERIDRMMKNYSGTEIGEKELTTLSEEDVLGVLSQASMGVSPEYEKAKAEISEAKIYQFVAQNDLPGASIALCQRLEALLKYVYKYSGDLCEMINLIREKNPQMANIIGKSGFDCLHKIRTFRNAHVHSSPAENTVSAKDVAECIEIIKKLETNV